MDLMGYVILWLICGFIAGAIYNNKGRSALTGFLAGVLLGPLGVILALVSGNDKKGLARREAEEVEKQVEAGELKKCPYCAELVKAEAIVCKHCGRDLAPSPTAQE
jgi:hypothetical protein